MIISAPTFNPALIGHPKSYLDAAMITRLTYGLWVASWLSFSQVTFCSKTTLFRVCSLVWSVLSGLSRSIWWKRVALSPTFSPEKVWSTRRLMAMKKVKAKARRKHPSQPMAMRIWKSTSSLRKRRLWRSVWSVRTSTFWISWDGCLKWIHSRGLRLKRR